MKKNGIVVAYKKAEKNLQVSRSRLKEAKKASRYYADDEIKALEVELEEDEAEFAARQEQLKNAIAKIPEKMVRRVVEDHYIKDYTLENLANTYGYSVSSIKKLLQSARERIDLK